MNIQEELETLRASERIKHANLQELARLVLAFDDADDEFSSDPDCPGLSDKLQVAFNVMVNFAKGVAQ